MNLLISGVVMSSNNHHLLQKFCKEKKFRRMKDKVLIRKKKIQTIYIFLLVFITVQLLLSLDCKMKNTSTRSSFLVTNQCVPWKNTSEILKENKEKQIEPYFRLRNNRFILPWLYNGPTNQLFGLRQAAYIAITLNRTLVLPIFFKHFTDVNETKSVKVQVDPAVRLVIFFEIYIC